MPSPNANLLNLQKIGKLKSEAPDQGEFDSLVQAAGRRLVDAANLVLSSDSRFSLAYDAAHSFALAALRWHGFRSENRYLVFQVLANTVAFPTNKWRLLAECHEKRNRALYDGDPLDDEQLIKEFIAVTKDLQAAVMALGPVGA